MADISNGNPDGQQGNQSGQGIRQFATDFATSLPGYAIDQIVSAAETLTEAAEDVAGAAASKVVGAGFSFVGTFVDAVRAETPQEAANAVVAGTVGFFVGGLTESPTAGLAAQQATSQALSFAKQAIDRVDNYPSSAYQLALEQYRSIGLPGRVPLSGVAPGSGDARPRAFHSAVAAGRHRGGSHRRSSG